MTGSGIYPALWNTGTDNRIINGDFPVDQRNEGASTTPASAGYICDKWRQGQTQASKLSFQRTGAFTCCAKSLTVTVAASITAGASDQFTLQQRIEGLQVGDLGFGGTPNCGSLILSFNAKASVTGTYCVALQNSAANRSYLATFTLTAATPKTVILAIPPDITGTWLTTNGIGINVLFDLGAGSTFQGTANTWQAGQFTSVSGNVVLVNNAAATFQITNVRLYPGSAAVPYVPRPYNVEFLACCRDYQKTFPDGTAPAQSAGVTGALTTKNPIALGDPSEEWQFMPKMRATPTITTYNPSAANANWRDITAGADATVSVDPATTVSARGVLLATSGTITTLGDILAIHAVADAGL